MFGSGSSSTRRCSPRSSATPTWPATRRSRSSSLTRSRRKSRSSRSRTGGGDQEEAERARLHLVAHGHGRPERAPRAGSFDSLLAPLPVPAAAGGAGGRVAGHRRRACSWWSGAPPTRRARGGQARDPCGAVRDPPVQRRPARDPPRPGRDPARTTPTYLRLSLVPMLWVIVPLALVIAQLQFHYGYAAIVQGQPVLVKAQLRDASGRAPPLTATADAVASLEAPAGFGSRRPPSGCPAPGRSSGGCADGGQYELRVHVGGETQTRRSLVTVRSGARRCASRQGC